ncbi:tail fiber protein [Sphingomonas sp.]|uniref:phage tail protein n=1 Tax=Sphingomonas sp. TaxID=28214 RepID=UPI0031D9BF5A
MSEPFIGQLMTVPYNFPPRGWAFCQGQILSIAQNTALFSLLGTTYGGNGQTTFALPDLRGRAPLSSGSMPGGSVYTLGQVGGSENTTLITNNMPAHNHTMSPGQVSVNAVNVKASEQAPQAGAFLGRGVDTAPNPGAIPEIYVPASAGAGQPLIPLGGVNVAGNTGISGSNFPFSTMQPYLVLNHCIALEGIFPSRN